MTKKQFCLEQIAPYYINPTICGYNTETYYCEYITEDGRMCVAGKNMINPESFSSGINTVLRLNPQENVFKPEVVNILTNDEWRDLQNIHDCIADGDSVDYKDFIGTLKSYINDLKLFTLEELEEYCKQLKMN